MNKDTKEIDNKLFLDIGLNAIGKKIKSEISSITGSGITLTNNLIKDIMKVIKSLENRGSTRKVTSQEGGFLNFLRPLMTSGLPSMKIVLTPLAKSVLISLGLSSGVSAADAATQKKNFGSGATVWIISNEEMEDIIKLIKSLEASGLLIEEISETT